jgi:RNA 2',3'-cyclic 3'-phosphodiesterase
MRLFTALDLPAEIASNLEDLLRRLRPSVRINWSPPANLHVTTKFIGEWHSERLDELKSALGALPRRPSISVRVHNVGFFPNARSPRVFWCGIDAPGLSTLAADTDQAAAGLGIEPESRPFSPHLTLARSKDRVNLDSLNAAVAVLPSTDFGAFEARSFFFYLSQLRAGGSVYTKLAEFPLSPQ